ncbi:hypothetical protein BJV78DRAFT_475037 [Lactifluus subvellereus]|nr:hypothetical protein BJV78DRAFT_475037 [Lactifluus subvellereus]
MQAMEQAATSTQQAVAAISPPSSSGDDPATCSSSDFPLQYALNALQYLQALHSRSDTESDGWTLISEKGFPLRRKLSAEISGSLPVYKGERVIEGIGRHRGGGDELRRADAVGQAFRWRSCVRGLCRRGWSTHGVCSDVDDGASVVLSQVKRRRESIGLSFRRLDAGCLFRGSENRRGAC